MQAIQKDNTAVANTLTRTLKKTPVTSGALLLCIAVYLITAAQSGSLANNTYASPLAADFYLFFPDVTNSSLGFLRGLTFSFVHSGPSHLIFNGFMLWLFGTSIERNYGSVAFALIFIATSYGSATMIELMDPVSLTVGASGVIYGLMAITVGMYAGDRTQLRALFILIFVNLAYSIITPGVSLWGHIGGLISGALVAVAIYLAQVLLGVRGWKAGPAIRAGVGLLDFTTGPAFSAGASGFASATRYHRARLAAIVGSGVVAVILVWAFIWRTTALTELAVMIPLG